MRMRPGRLALTCQVHRALAASAMTLYMDGLIELEHEAMLLKADRVHATTACTEDSIPLRTVTIQILRHRKRWML